MNGISTEVVMLLGHLPRKGTTECARKVKKGRPRCSKSAPAIIMSDITNKRKQWTDTSICLAMKAVTEGSSISQAAHTHGVPYTTLYDRMSGKVCHGENPGPRPYLSKPEEKDLSDFLVEVAKAGYGKSWQQVKALAANAIREKAAKANHRKSAKRERTCC